MFMSHYHKRGVKVEYQKLNFFPRKRFRNEPLLSSNENSLSIKREKRNFCKEA